MAFIQSVLNQLLRFLILVVDLLDGDDGVGLVLPEQPAVRANDLSLLQTEKLQHFLMRLAVFHFLLQHIHNEYVDRELGQLLRFILEFVEGAHKYFIFCEALLAESVAALLQDAGLLALLGVLLLALGAAGVVHLI